MNQLLAIRAFARVVEAGSFTKAADSLDMPNASLSKLVQELESHLGVRLLQRTTRRVTVTPDGQDYYEKTALILRNLEDVDTSFNIARSKPRGQLRVDTGGSTASEVLIPALPDFLARYPDIRIDLGVSDRSVDMVSDNVDCVIRGGPLDNSSLVARLIGEATMVTCATPEYLKQYGVPAYPEELKNGHRLVAYMLAQSGRAIPFRFLHDGEKTEIKIEHRIGVNESNGHMGGRAGRAGHHPDLRLRRRRRHQGRRAGGDPATLAAGALPVPRGLPTEPPRPPTPARLHRLAGGDLPAAPQPRLGRFGE